ncbi:phosphoribosylformylglycinamidine synthase subunit PurS [Lactobacillus corticis]|uniref:Phosphoribosylformylglycinamidine synthase subunit PurS n=1 Tax=Lactobacillus corticis TaxID=2201249 RepID=A0A916VHK0_9LACO|nr:phosphoribosylformylglycinamidine synthase subunit PurS [Lactobacillus corticis]GFZ26717.1 phosphoribosylformylglycinamidine synthase [Lactobacillus corticis]
MSRVRIYVTYKPSVFDPQGATILDTIQTALGHQEVSQVTVGKFFDLTLPAANLDASVKEIAEKLLVNVNMETYRYEVLEEAE